MKNQLNLSVLSVLALLLFSCGGKKDKPITKNQDSLKDTSTQESNMMDPTSAIGYYVGEFDAVEYDEKKKPSYNNKINISVDSIRMPTIYGHSIVAGNLVAFIGEVTVNGNMYKVTNAVEQGKNKYNGVFAFDLDLEKGNLKGTWVSNDKKTAVTKCEFDLMKKVFKYDPTLSIDDLRGHSVYDPETENEQEGEAITGDIEGINPSVDLLKEKDVANLYKGDLEVLRNSIYARHGYSFQNRKMRYLFDDLDWYIPVSINITPDLTEIEKKNIALLKRYEDHADRYYDSWGR